MMASFGPRIRFTNNTLAIQLHDIDRDKVVNHVIGSRNKYGLDLDGYLL